MGKAIGSNSVCYSTWMRFINYLDSYNCKYLLRYRQVEHEETMETVVTAEAVKNYLGFIESLPDDFIIIKQEMLSFLKNAKSLDEEMYIGD